MKIRNGFVSNSSSSSFTMILTDEDHQKLLKAMDPDLRKYIDYMVGRIKLGSENLVVFDTHSGEAFEDTPSCGEIRGLDAAPNPWPNYPRNVAQSEIDREEFYEGLYAASTAYQNAATKLKCKAIVIDLYL